MAIEKFVEVAADAYSYDKTHNVTEDGVIMVTITLSEYRELVTAKAKAEQSKYDMDNWQLRNEVNRLKQQILDMAIGDEG